MYTGNQSINQSIIITHLAQFLHEILRMRALLGSWGVCGIVDVLDVRLLHRCSDVLTGRRAKFTRGSRALIFLKEMKT
jgi:hypothetical protein